MTINFELTKIILQFKEQMREIHFNHITYIHGETSTGKTSIAGLVDYCLGGDFVFPPVIDEELVYAELYCNISINNVVLRRYKRTNKVHVSWGDEHTYNSIIAPIEPAPEGNPIFSTDIYNISDLLFHLMGMEPIKVPKSKINVDTQLVRLSFRDIMWYCYLKQSTMLSQFFMLKNSERMYKSRDVMRFIVGLYNERLNELGIKLNKIKETKLEKQLLAAKTSESINLLGYKSESDLDNEIDDINFELNNIKKDMLNLRNEYNHKAHFTDDLREDLRKLSYRLAHEEDALIDLEKKIAQHEALKSEFISSKLKLERIQSASIVLSKAKFNRCPLCGNNVEEKSKEDQCPLCKVPITKNTISHTQNEIMKNDLTSRILELNESIQMHKTAYDQQRTLTIALKKEKEKLDKKLIDELAMYDSDYLARSRDLERKISALEEKLRNANKIKSIIANVAKLKDEADEYIGEISKLERYIREETSKISPDKYIEKIEKAYAYSLKRVNVPNVGPNDTISIDRDTWIPTIVPAGNGQPWDFYSLNAGGASTLLNVCYALTLHKVAAENNLPLPAFLIIDNPMQGIGKDVDKEIYVKFYEYLYELSEGPLSKIQFVIIEKECVYPRSGIKSFSEVHLSSSSPYPPIIGDAYSQPSIETSGFSDIYLTSSDPSHPPLVPYRLKTKIQSNIT